LPSSIGEDAIRNGMPVTLRFEDGRTECEIKITQARKQKRLVIARFATITTADDAERLVGAELWTTRDKAALAQNEYVDGDLIGCALVQGDRPIGIVRTVRHYPAQDMLELDSGGAAIYEESFNLKQYRSDVASYPVPFDKITAAVCPEAKLRKLVKNMVFVGVVAQLLSIDLAVIEASVKKQFAKKQKVFDLNFAAVKASGESLMVKNTIFA